MTQRDPKIPKCDRSTITFNLNSMIAVFLISTLASCTPKDADPPIDPTYGDYKCEPRTATADPPPRIPPDPTTEEKEQERPKSVFTKKLCADGKIPMAEPALPNVAKGNPLIGPVDSTVTEYFDEPRGQIELIKKALRPYKEVFPFGPDGEDEQTLLPDPPGCNGVASFGSCYYYGSAAYRRRADGGGMTMTIERPAYDGSGGSGHSLDEIAVQGGTGDGDIIELGWNVSTSQYSNANPHLFVFHWIGWSPTCYDACNWQQYSATYFPGMDLNAMVGQQVYIGYVYYQGNWWAWFDNQWLGYYPGNEWGGAYQKNELIQWFGEVATANGLPPRTDMGNGNWPTSPAVATNATLCDVNAVDWVCWYRDQQNWGATFPTYYQIDRTGFGRTGYGGPGE